CVLDAARSAGVRAVVHTSSVDAVYSGQPIVGGDESMPTPSHFPNTYCRTKAQAEQRVLAAHHPEATPRVVVLRLVGLYGERDPYHLGQVLKMARGAPLVRIGDGTAKADHMYVGNAAHALLVAAADLLGEAKGAGSIYFVTDHAPANFFDFVEPIVTGVGLRVLPWSLALPQRLMWVLGALLEAVAWCLGPLISWRPGLSRFAVDFVCQEITCSSQRFRKELGYTPKYSHREALDRTIAWFVRHPVA
ncbi:MAG: NAD-dependent epimerase/dehydratase family protein, partial [Myxococcota bacterium]